MDTVDILLNAFATSQLNVHVVTTLYKMWAGGDSKVQAIKWLRGYSGCSLLQAKEITDLYFRVAPKRVAS